MADLRIRIYTGRKCGWAVRNYCAMIEKGVAFDTIPSVDAEGRKLPEFLEISPFGHTPVLVHGATSVFDSVLINDYIEDRFPDPPLLPESPAERIESHKWIRYCETALIAPLGRVARASGSTARTEASGEFEKNLSWFLEHVVERGFRGPFFFGEQFSLLDIAFLTYFRLAGAMAPVLDDLTFLGDTRLKLWEAGIISRDSVRQAQQIQIDLTY